MDVDEASSLSFKQDYIDIYSNSWGPKDNGFSVEGVGPLVNKVFQNGANQVKLWRDDQYFLLCTDIVYTLIQGRGGILIIGSGW